MEFINQYIQENNLHLNTADIKSKYFCRICKNILCQPKLSTCGCSYCNSCITRSLEIDNTKCPSCHSDIDAELGIHCDIRMNMKVQELELECPNTFCNEKVAVKDMENHIKDCDNKGCKCPFNSYGCSNMLIHKQELKAHLDENAEEHFNILINNTQEMSSMVADVKNDSLENARRFDDLGNRLDETNVEIRTMKDYIENTKNEILRTIINENIINLKAQAAKDKCFKDDLAYCKGKLTVLQKENVDLKKHIKKIEEFMSGKAKRDMNNVQKNIEKLDNKIRTPIKFGQDSSSYSTIPSECTVEFRDIYGLEKIVDHFSSVITIDQYSFQMRLRINHRDNVGVTVVLVSNESVDAVQWPIPFNMKVSLMAENGIVVRARKFGYSSSKSKTNYEKPEGINRKIITDSNIDGFLPNLGKKCFVKLEII